MRFTVMAVLCVLMVGLKAFACSCIGTSTVKGALQSSDVVIVGTVISMEQIEFTDSSFSFGTDSAGRPRYLSFLKAKYQVVVSESFKGKHAGDKGKHAGDTLTFVTGIGGGDCGFHFITGQSYIIYGFKTGKSTNPSLGKRI